jgi:hypothetical protein
MTGIGRVTALALACALGGAVGAGRATAGSWCGPTEPVCADFWAADAVFVGRVVGSPPDRRPQVVPLQEGGRPGVEQIQVTSEPFNQPRPVVVELLEGFRGLGDLRPGARIDVDAAESIRGGHTYMFFAHRRDGRLTVYGCARTRPLFEAAADLLYARGLAASTETTARVFGTLQWQIQPEPESGARRTSDPLPTATVTLTGQGVERRMTTDDEGRWETRLPPGTYRARVELPAEYTGGGDRGEFTIADPRACQRLDATIDWNGRLTGRVVDAAGRPLVGVDVHCTSPGQGRPFWVPRFTRTDDEGRFHFKGLERGQQEVRIGIQLMPPGTGAPDDATQLPIVRTLEFKPAQAMDLGTLALSPAVRTTTVRGKVVDANGHPVRDAMLFMGATVEDAGFPEARTDAEGGYVFAAIPGRRYVVGLISVDADTVRTQPFVAGRVAGPPPIVAPPAR